MSVIFALSNAVCIFPPIFSTTTVSISLSSSILATPNPAPPPPEENGFLIDSTNFKFLSKSR